MMAHSPLFRLPLPVLATFLVALATLFGLGGSSPLIVLFAVAVALTYAVPLRLESWWATWLFRLACFAAAYYVGLHGNMQEQGGLLDVTWTRVAGAIGAAEVTVQAWRQQPDPRGFVILPSLMVLAGCNSVNGPWDLVYISLFMLCLGLGAPYYRPRAGARPLSAHVAAGAAVLAVLGLGFATTVWVDANRYEFYQLGDQLVSAMSQQVVGVSTSPQLGRTNGMVGPADRMLRIEGPLADGHLRVASFDEYARHGWGEPLLRRNDYTLLPKEQTGERVGLRLRITELRPSSHMLFLPLDAASVSAPVSVKYETTYWDPLRVMAKKPISYTVSLARTPDARMLPTLEEIGGAYARDRLVAPSRRMPPAVERLALSIAPPTATPQEKIAAVTHYLTTHHRYSLSYNPGPGEPIANFLLRGGDAHCEYFASAAAILLRYLGVPTRYVVGYYAHERIGRDTVVVRQRDAHAWAESWVDGVGWVVVEATPADGRPDETTNDQPGRWQRIWEWLGDTLQGLRNRWTGILLWGSIVLGVVVLPLLIYQMWRANRGGRRRRTRGYSAQDPALLALAARFDRWLARRGTPCPPAQPWQDHLEGFDAPAAAWGFVRQYNLSRFGTLVDDETVASMQAQLAALEAEERTRRRRKEAMR